MSYFSRHYAILELDKAIGMMRAGTLPKYPLAITFDDGYRNFYTHAFPILKKMRIPATMFIAADFVSERKPLWVDRLEYAIGNQAGGRAEKIARDKKIRDELKKLPDDEKEKLLQEIERVSSSIFSDFDGDRVVYAPLSKSEILEMKGASIKFGAHTKSHPILSKLSPARLGDEVRGSKEALKDICGGISDVFAYPNGQPGDWNEATESAVSNAGFSFALTTVEGVNGKDAHSFRLKRMTMDGTGAGAAFAAVAAGVRLFLSKIKHLYDAA